MSTESTLQAYIVKYAKEHNTLCYKFASPSRRGVPDLIMIPFKGAAYFIEVKHPNGKGVLSALQEHHIQLLKNQGAEVYVIDSKEEARNVIAIHTAHL
jgi:hypothetical protein